MDLVAISALATVSASLGKALQANSGPEDVIRGNIYIIGFAESGTGKSRVFRHATAPIQKFEKERLDYFMEITQPELTAELRILKSKITNLEGQLSARRRRAQLDRAAIKDQLQEKLRRCREIEDQLHPPRVIIEDATTEAAALVLSNNGEQAVCQPMSISGFFGLRLKFAGCSYSSEYSLCSRLSFRFVIRSALSSLRYLSLSLNLARSVSFCVSGSIPAIARQSFSPLGPLLKHQLRRPYLSVGLRNNPITPWARDIVATCTISSLAKSIGTLRAFDREIIRSAG